MSYASTAMCYEAIICPRCSSVSIVKNDKYEAMNMIRKGQVEGIGKGDIRGEVRFVADLFNVAA